MLEKIFNIESVPLVDFLGIQNRNIKEIATAFPDSQVISRGTEIRIQGTSSQIIKINEILNSLLTHYNKYGRVTQEDVITFINEEKSVELSENEANVLVFGNRGFKVVPKTANQRKLVEAVEKNDLVFAVGPAGTGKTYVAVALAVRALKNKEIKKVSL